MKKHSHIISVCLMVLACLIAAREYYIGYEIENSINSEDIGTDFGVDLFLNTPHASSSQGKEPNTEKFDHSQYPTYHAALILSHAKLSSQYEKEQILQIGKGDTIGSILSDIGISKQEIDNALKALRTHYNTRDLKIGQSIIVRYEQETEDTPSSLLALEFKPTSEHYIILQKTSHGLFKAEKKTVPLLKTLRRIEGTIKSSFYTAALKKDVPAKVVKEAVTALSYTMNFQHGIKSGDPFELLYEEYQDHDGNVIKTGDLKYVSVLAGGQVYRIYRFAPRNSSGSYYNAKGESIVRGLLQTPIDPSRMRITSKFQKGRMHPLKGFRRDHKGVDFGAPYGTAVMAAGDGVVVKAGYFGDYGKYVRIKHSGGYETVYAHLSKISPEVQVGARVRQRQVIGNVGATGLATAPHLHHEVIYNNTHIDPQSVKQLPSTQLSGKELQQFQMVKKEVDRQIVGLPLKNQFVKKNRPDDKAAG